jgi:hypothetical protein
MLFPSQAPVAEPGSVTVSFNAMRTIPTDHRWMSLIVFTKDQEKLLELEPSLTESNAEKPGDTMVRGQTGQVFGGRGAGEWTLTWLESGQAYSASSEVLTVDEAVAWLETWYALPDSSATGSVTWTDVDFYGPDGDYPRYAEGLVDLQVDFKTGYLDTTGAWAVEPRFAEARPFSEGLALVYSEDADRRIRCGYVDTTGAYVIRTQAMHGEMFSSGLAPVSSDGGDRYINKTGAYAFERAYDVAFPFSEGLAVVNLDRGSAQSKWAVVDTTGAIIWRLK